LTIRIAFWYLKAKGDLDFEFVHRVISPMKKLMLIFSLLFLLFHIFIPGEYDFPTLKGPYLGQNHRE